MIEDVEIFKDSRLVKPPPKVISPNKQNPKVFRVTEVLEAFRATKLPEAIFGTKAFEV